MTAAPRPAISGNRIDLALQDIGPVFSNLRVSWNAMSPLAATLDSHAQTNRSVVKRASVDAPSIDPRIAATLARPDVRINHLVADASGEWSVFIACWRRANPDTFVLLIPRSPEDYSVLRFNSRASYLEWLVDELSSDVDQTIPNYLPPQLPLATLTCAFHAVDAHRRATLRRASEYGGSEPLWISAADFASTMRTALRSRDTRWLLPAFISLTPGVIPLLREPSVEQLSWLEDAAFLHPRPHPRTGEDGFVFGEAAEAFGEELPGGLKRALGFAVDIWSDNGTLPLAQAFLAPTSAANHLVRIEAGDDGAVVNHQAMPQVQLYLTLDALLTASLDPGGRERAMARAARFDRASRNAASQARIQPPPRTTPRVETPAPLSAESASRWAPPSINDNPPTSSTPARNFCRQCGATLTPGSRFCRKCGNDTQAVKKLPVRQATVSQPTARREEVSPQPASSSTPRPAKPPSRVFQRILRVVVPIVSVLITYFLTRTILGPMLGEQFGDAARQIVPVLVSMAVGSIARRLIK